MIEVTEIGYSTPKQIQDIIIDDAITLSTKKTYSIDKIKDLIENSTPEILPLREFANNTTALAGGLAVNDLYRLPIANNVSLVAVVLPPPRNFKIKGNFSNAGITEAQDFSREFHRINSGWTIKRVIVSPNTIEADLNYLYNGFGDLSLKSLRITEVIRFPNNIPLSTLDLSNNLIVNFNPDTLPRIREIRLSNNRLVYMNSFSTINTEIFRLDGNLMTLAGYQLMEVWAQNVYPGQFDFYNNTDSTNNTNLKSILISREATVYS